MPYMTARIDGRRRAAVPPQVRRPVLGLGPRLRPRPDVLVSPGVRAGPLQRRGDHRPPGDVARAPAGRRASQTLDGQKVYIATTVGDGCCLGAEPADGGGTDDLKAAYAVFKEEARDVAPEYAPKTVNTDGWKGTQAAWKALFPQVVILLCFLHAWLKIRDRAKH